jgi:hypothetical protein
MDIKKFLIQDNALNKAELAKLIWPDRFGSDRYLNQILMGERDFSLAEAQRAMRIIHGLAQNYSRLRLEGTYPDA